MVHFQILWNMEKTFSLHREFFPPQPPFFVMKKHQCIMGQVKLKICYFMEVANLLKLLPSSFDCYALSQTVSVFSVSLFLSHMHTWFLWLNQVSRGTAHFLCHNLDLKSGSEISHIAKNLNVIPKYDMFFKNSLTVIWVTEERQRWRVDVKRSKKIFPLPLNALCVSSNVATDFQCPILDLLK